MLGCAQVMGCWVQKIHMWGQNGPESLPLLLICLLCHPFLFHSSLYNFPSLLPAPPLLCSAKTSLEKFKVSLHREPVFSSTVFLLSWRDKNYILYLKQWVFCIYTSVPHSFPLIVLYFMFFWFPWSSFQCIECGEKLGVQKIWHHPLENVRSREKN